MTPRQLLRELRKNKETVKTFIKDIIVEIKSENQDLEQPKNIEEKKLEETKNVEETKPEQPKQEEKSKK